MTKHKTWIHEDLTLSIVLQIILPYPMLGIPLGAMFDEQWLNQMNWNEPPACCVSYWTLAAEKWLSKSLPSSCNSGNSFIIYILKHRKAVLQSSIDIRWSVIIAIVCDSSLSTSKLKDELLCSGNDSFGISCNIQFFMKLSISTALTW